MADLELTDQEAALLNRALAGEEVELDERQAALLQQALGGGVPTSAPKVEPGMPLDRALKTQQGDVVTVETPTGPAQFTRDGQRVLSAEEAQQQMEGGAARLKERALEEGVTFFANGGKLLDELAGLGAAQTAIPRFVASKVTGQQAMNPLEAYVQQRNRTRADVAAAERNSPTVNVAGLAIKPVAVAGAVAPSLGVGLPETVLGRLALGGGTAILDEVGASEADLTKGEAGQFGKDVVRAGAGGVLAAGAGELATAPLRAIASRASRESALARQALEGVTQEARDKAARSALGSLGGVVSAQGNAAETIGDIMRNPHLYSQPVVLEAYNFMRSPEGQQLMNRAALNNIERMPGLLAREADARSVLGAAQSAAAPSAVAQEVAQKVAPSAVASDVGKKFMRSVGQRAALSAGGAGVGALISEATGGDWRTGGAIGAGSGWATPGVLQFLRNQSSNPALQTVANRAMADLLELASNATARGARSVEPAAAQATRDDSRDRLTKTFAEYQRRLAEKR